MESLIENSSFVLSFFLGIGLAAAAGFRIFVPIFLLSLATYFGVGNDFEITSSWKWLGELPTVIALGIATLVEIIAYFIPYIDNLLDTIAVPLAGIAGTFLLSSQIVEFSPMYSWGLAIIAGGGTAAAIKSATSAGRLTSTVTTGGAGNFMVSSVETATASILGVMAIFLPVIAFVLVLIIGYYLFKFGRRFFRKKKNFNKP